jgi:CHASE1-domain containing sensor protein/nitrogen-specific signal transduction histidine kinase
MGEATQLSDKRATDASTAEANPYPGGLRPMSRKWFPAAVFFTGIILTLLAAYYASRTIQLRTRTQFETAALRARNSIRERFEIYDAMLHGAAGFLAVEKQVTRERFRKYVERLSLEVNYPGVQGIGFAPRVPASEKDAMVGMVRQEGEQNFRIWPDSTRPDYFPVAYLEPRDPRNEAALGYDMFDEPARREAMERARDTGKSAASTKVTLIQETKPEKQAGFLIYFPVYTGGEVPETIEERRTQLQGFVYCAFRAGDLFDSIFREEALGAQIEIFDGTNTDNANLLFRSEREKRSSLPFRKTFEEVTQLNIGSRTWTARFVAQPEVERVWTVMLLLLGGVLLSAAMFYLMQAEGRARRAAERAAAQLRTSELALRESEERLRRYATELEHRVAERTANLAQSIQSLEGVLYHVAHDLRAPLRSMASFTSILMEEYGPRLDERGLDYARRVSKAAQRMDGLVQDLLAYGRLAHVAVPVGRINLDAEVNVVLNRFSEEIESCGAKVEVRAPLPPVKANAGVLAQALSNLISNGLKFVPAGTQPHLRIFAEHKKPDAQAEKVNGAGVQDGRDGQEFVRLWIEDNGIGIAPEYHERIFRMFERLHSADAYPGTGIGLAIVRKGVERMGGRVGVESASGGGSRFWLELPAA